MGTVSSEIECPKCKYARAYYELNYRTRDEYFHCGRCGYSVVVENGKEKEQGSLGSYGVFFGGFGELGHFATLEQIESFKEDFKKGMKNGAGESATFVYFTFWDEEKKDWLANVLSHNKIVPFDLVEEMRNPSEETEMEDSEGTVEGGG